MKTKYLDNEIELLNSIKRNNELSGYGKEKLNEFNKIKEQLLIHSVSQQRELLNSFMDYLQESENDGETIIDRQAFINGFLETI
jgi:hypothetical protein